jgi:diguanylate cyclase (GGDEF)-like protein/PAS domain S-box-containing protein
LLYESSVMLVCACPEGKRMDFAESPMNRFSEELDLLRKQIADLKDMMLESAPAVAARERALQTAQRALERIRAEIQAQHGFIPPFFAPASDVPEVFASLWQQMRSSYLKAPIPALTKEKLFARLSRACPKSYAILAHSCALKSLGMHAGEVLRWLEQPVPASEEDLEPHFSQFAGVVHPLVEWPEPGSLLEEALLQCSIYSFHHAGESAKCRAELMGILGSANYARLQAFLMYVRMHHSWLEAYPEPDWEQDEMIRSNLQAMLEEEPGLGPFFERYLEEVSPRRHYEEGYHLERQVCERILRDTQEGIFTFDRDLVCTLLNPAMERIAGTTAKDALGHIVFEAFPFLVETGDDRHLLEALRGESVAVQDRPYRALETDAEGFCDAQYSPLFNGEGKVSGGIAFVRDTTERRRAELGQRATEERYLELFENANDVVYTHDLSGCFTSVNKAAERITGYARAEALQMKASQLVAPEHMKIACKMIERQVAGEGPLPYELDVICRDGRRVTLEVNTHIISRDGKPVGVQGIARDITERKKTAEALQQAKQNLEAWVHELEQRTREMTLLSEMGDMLRACLTTEEAYSVIVRVAQQIFPVQVGALYVISPARNLVEAVAVWGDASRIERVFSPDECWALRRGRVHWVEDSSVGLLCKHLHKPLPEGYLCVPMMAQSQALGILLLTQPPNARLTEAKQRLALAMAEHIAMALSNLKLNETLRSQSIRDPLTSLFNRRFLEESLELELRRAARNRRPLGMIMLEIDDFQALSRSGGEEAEKAVLVEIGNLLQTIIRKEDIACRFGTEKFAIILPQGSLEVTAQRASSLREMVKGLEIRHRGRPIGHVTCSAGIACFPDQGRTVEALIRAADASLQRAKSDGGDRVVTAQ